MINKLLDNCFLTELTTRVEEVREENGMYWHCFKDTIFYQGKGGMADDSGLINKLPVRGLKVEEGRFWHLMDTKLEGTVFMNVNPHERFLKCQAHTAQHLLSAIVEGIYGVHTTSHHVAADECYVEFDLKEFDRRKAIELQVTCNGLIRDDLEVQIIYPTASDARILCPRSKLPAEDIRLVRIGNIDVTPCGCMHVPSLRYLQMIQIIGFEKSSRGYRIRYASGDQLLDNINRRYEVLDEACASLAVSHIYLNTGISRLLSQRNTLQKELEGWKKRYFDKVCGDVVKEAGRLLFRRYEDYEPEDIRQLARMIVENSECAVCFLSEKEGRAKVVLAAHPASDVDLHALRQQFINALCLKGGGSDRYMEFGGAASETLEQSLRQLVAAENAKSK